MCDGPLRTGGPASPRPSASRLELSPATQQAVAALACSRGIAADQLVTEAISLWAQSAASRGHETREAASGWDTLPGSVFAELHELLEGRPGCLPKLRLVCSSWERQSCGQRRTLRPRLPTYGKHCIQKPFARLFPNLETLELLHHPHFGRRPEDVDALQGLHMLTSLSFPWHGDISEVEVRKINDLRALQSVGITLRKPVGVETFHVLQGLRASLALTWCSPGANPDLQSCAEALHLLPTLAKLSVVVSPEGEAMDPRLSLLTPLTSFHRLQMREAQLDSSQLDVISSLTSLRVLSLDGCVFGGPSRPNLLSGLTGLRSLDLRSQSEAEDADGWDLSLWSGLSLLSSLSWLDISWRGAWVADGTLDAITGLSSLTCLNAEGLESISVLGLRALARLTGLEYLNLGSCGAEHGFRELEPLSRLKMLGLGGCHGLGPDDVRVLCRAMPDLEALDVCFNYLVGDSSCGAIASCQKLASLTMEETELSAEGLLLLIRMTSLTSLNIRSCPGLRLGLGALALAGPNLKFIDAYLHSGDSPEAITRREEAAAKMLPSTCTVTDLPEDVPFLLPRPGDDDG